MIYTRIDTYSVILYNVSIRQTLEHFDLPIENLDEIYKNSYKKIQVNIGDTYVWANNGIRLECKLDEYLQRENENCSIFDIVFQWLRVYISGEGISYIEEVHKEVEGYSLQVLLSSPNFYDNITTEYRITRCDFAFDYVNYEGNEFANLRKLLLNAEFDENLSEKGRLFTGVGSGLSYSCKSGKDKTIYLGTTSADRMLRIYDKKYQLCPEGIWDLTKVPQVVIDNEIEITSWYRIELQTRDDFAFRYLISSGGDFRYIMGEINAYFDVRKKDGKKLAPLHKIFLWTQRTPIIQNANCTKRLGEKEVIEAYIEHIAFRKLHVYITAFGMENFRQFLNSCVRRRANGTLEKRVRYITRFNNELLNLKNQNDIKFYDDGDTPHAFQNSDGFYYIRSTEIKEENKI